jgi:MraZ protein
MDSNFRPCYDAGEELFYLTTGTTRMGLWGKLEWLTERGARMFKSKPIGWITGVTLVCLAGVAIACRLKDGTGQSAQASAVACADDKKPTETPPPPSDLPAAPTDAKATQSPPLPAAVPPPDVPPTAPPTISIMPIPAADAAVAPLPPESPKQEKEAAPVAGVKGELPPVPLTPAKVKESPKEAPPPAPLATDPPATIPSPCPVAPVKPTAVENPPTVPVEAVKPTAPLKTPSVLVPATPADAEEKPEAQKNVYWAKQPETLREIARKTLGSGDRWKELDKLNPELRSGAVVPSGTMVRLPGEGTPPAGGQAEAEFTAPIKSGLKPLPIVRWHRPENSETNRGPFTGSHECKTDEKHGLTLPKDVIEQLGKSEKMLLTPGPDRCLWLVSQSGATGMLRRVEKARIADGEAQAFRRLYFSQSEKASIDATGRMQVPEKLAEYAGLTGNTVIVGIDDHFEVWEASRWQRYSQNRSSKTMSNQD